MAGTKTATSVGVISLLLGASITFSSFVPWINFAIPMCLAMLLEIVAVLSFYRAARQSNKSRRSGYILGEVLSVMIGALALKRLLIHWGVTL